MAELYVAIWWHQHQPYYYDEGQGLCILPWVRLHGVKDYFGMAALLKKYPPMKATINLVPSMLAQIEGYVKNGVRDKDFIISSKPADSLSEEDRQWMLRSFFLTNPQKVIRPHRRYADLFEKAKKRLKPSAFSEAEMRDLQVWWNLIWFHPLTIEQDDSLASLIRKGRDYTEDEKSYVLARQMEILGEVIPLQRELAESGQVELTTTPYYHPILPLLCDPTSAREAMPNVKLPTRARPLPEDAAEQVRRAVEYHKQLFGSKPVGMWPSEGSVSEKVMPILADTGITWIGTDEEILENSLRLKISRDAHGHVTDPSLLYKPYSFRFDQRRVNILFRDHNFSDLIGFQYQNASAPDAVKDFFRRLNHIKKSLPADARALVSVILDGENAWEYYDNSGLDFLSALYERMASRREVTPVTPSEYLSRYPETTTLNKLFAGSWISHNFAIWIGGSEDNKAWDYLYRTREFLQRQRGKDESALKQAWEHIYAAEGSDWFWWYGDDHVSAQAAQFDLLFRRHLARVYSVLGEPKPDFLDVPISRESGMVQLVPPRSFLHVNVDGRLTTFFEWTDAGKCDPKKRGSMTETTAHIMTGMQFGFDERNLFIRIDGAQDLAAQLSDKHVLRIAFYAPAEHVLEIEGLSAGSPRISFADGADAQDAAAAVDEVIEVAIPFAALKVKAGQNLGFYVQLILAGVPVERMPAIGGVEFAVPSPDFERIAWLI